MNNDTITQEVYSLSSKELEKLAKGHMVSIITKDFKEVIIRCDPELDIEEQISKDEEISQLVADIQDEERD